MQLINAELTKEVLSKVAVDKEKQEQNLKLFTESIGIKDDESYLVEPAFEAHRKLSKKKIKAAKANNNFGWNQFNADAMYKGHEKRVKAAFSKRRKSNNGNAISSSGLDRMAEEVKERKAIRANFSRRRQQYDEEDVNYINERNRGFNKKLDRRFYNIESDLGKLKNEVIHDYVLKEDFLREMQSVHTKLDRILDHLLAKS